MALGVLAELKASESHPSFVASANDVVHMEGVLTGGHDFDGESPYLKLDKIRVSNSFTIRHNKERFFHPCIANKLPGVTKEVSSLGSLIFSGARTFPVTVPDRGLDNGFIIFSRDSKTVPRD